MPQTLFRTSFLQDTLEGFKPFKQTVVLSDGVSVTLLESGILRVTPATSNDTTKRLVLSCGVHGNETAPIEMVDTMVSELLAEKWSAQCHILFVIAHPQAIRAEQRFVDTNLNRLFADKTYESSQELKIAKTLKQRVKEFWREAPQLSRWHLDMHCAIRSSKHTTFAISPQSDYPTRQKELMEFMRCSGIEAVLLTEEPSSTFSWFSSSLFGAQAVTLELGQVAKFGHNDQQQLKTFNHALMNLIQSKPTTSALEMLTYEVDHSIYRQNDDFKFYFEASLPNFSEFEQGQVIGKDGDRELVMTVNQGRIVFPNPNVELSQRAALVVKPCATHYIDNQLSVVD